MPVQLKGPERGWTKLTTFSKELHDLSGPALFLDLDILILDSLDEFFKIPGDVIIVREHHRQHGKGNSSIYRFNIGSHPDVFTNFISNYEFNIRKYRNEQTYLSDYLTNKGVLSYWPETWIRNFKRHCMHSFPKSLFIPPTLPANARALIFHGHPNPEEAIVGKTGKWYRFAHPAKWILDYWK
jgi:alpha-N-acetylglucosamine transferase